MVARLKPRDCSAELQAGVGDRAAVGVAMSGPSVVATHGAAGRCVAVSVVEAMPRVRLGDAVSVAEAEP